MKFQMKNLLRDIKWRIIEFGFYNAAENMAIDEAIFQKYATLGQDTIRFYGWRPSTVSIGRHQAVEREVDINQLNAYGFEFVRRISGGGAVFHDEMGELTYSITTKVGNLESRNVESQYYELARFVFEPLVRIGLDLDYDQIHCPSVFTKGKKISGNAQARSGEIILQHGTILIDYRPEIMYSVLKARPGRTKEAMVESVYQKVTTLSEQLRYSFTPEKLANLIINQLKNSTSTESRIQKLEEAELDLALEISKKRYQKDSWNFGSDSNLS
ncbi:MAG: biotin/lipoate A/B protein ligase family protein [Candidatus Heimdallarchaeota archaeon]